MPIAAGVFLLTRSVLYASRNYIIGAKELTKEKRYARFILEGGCIQCSFQGEPVNAKDIGTKQILHIQINIV